MAGLYVQVTESKTRSFVFRYMRDGVAHEMGLGPLERITLAEAREEVRKYRRQILQGLDPLAERRREEDEGEAKVKALTFRQAAEALIESQRSGWRNSKHAAQWSSTLAGLRLSQAGRARCQGGRHAACSTCCNRSGLASRDREPGASAIEAVLDYASAIGKRSGENPARWRGHLDHLLAKPIKVRAVQHHAALDWRELPAFMAELAQRQTVDARARHSRS